MNGYQREAKTFLGKKCLGNKNKIKMDENKGFKMKGSSLYGKLKLNREGYKNMPDGRSTSSPFQEDEFSIDSLKKKKKGFPSETETKKKKTEVREGVTLDPGYEDTEKIQKVQREGITPHSQQFNKIAEEKKKKK